MDRVDVAIIGAGAAGLAAAHDLHEAGMKVAVFEARGRIGGRVFTVRDPRVPVPIELGAEFIHGETPETDALLEQTGQIAVSIRGEHRETRGGRIVPTRFWKHVDGILRRIDPERPDESFAAFLAREPGGPSKARDRAEAREFIQGFHSADLKEISAKSLAPEEGESPTENAARIARVIASYHTVPEALARGLGRQIHRKTAVTRVAWNRRGAELTLSAGTRTRRVRARRVIVTVPLGVLNAREGTRGAIAFHPDPPPLRRALQGLAMGSVVRLVIAFRELPWKDHPSLGEKTRAEDISFLHTRGRDFSVWWSAYPARWPLAVAWSGGPAAAALSRLKRPELERAAFRSLAEHLGVSTRHVSSRVVKTWTHDWNQDPYTRGSYSYLRVGGEGSAHALARPIGGTLFFAGEATESDQAGTVEGAIVSGQRAAKQVRRAAGR